jgi:hypothetical protein
MLEFYLNSDFFGRRRKSAAATRFRSALDTTQQHPAPLSGTTYCVYLYYLLDSYLITFVIMDAVLVSLFNAVSVVTCSTDVFKALASRNSPIIHDVTEIFLSG